MKHLFALLFSVVVITPTLAQKQGICGKVLWTSGNQMPGPDRKESGSSGVVREVYIYEVTRTTEVKEAGGFYTEIQTKLVKKVKSKKNGSFSVQLPEGTYSVFIKEPDGLWANIFDGKGQINPITVTSKNWTTFTINVNYQAAY